MLIIGHRGSPEAAPENTQASLAAALEKGTHVLETDIRLTADGHLVLSHDASFKRLGGPDTPVSGLTRTQLESVRLPYPASAGRPEETEPVLFMDQALELFPDALFNVDLKDPGTDIIHAWCRLLDETGAGDRCRTASFHGATIRAFRKIRPGADVSMPGSSVLRLLALTAVGIIPKPAREQNVLQVPETQGLVRILTPSRIRRWRRRGWKVQVWTVDTESEMKRLMNWGVDGIMTNRPDILSRLVSAG